MSFVTTKDIHAPIVGEKQDILDRRFLAARIYDRLSGDICPQVIGIYGGWGTGKTSLLNLLLAHNPKPVADSLKIHIEVFDSWQYEITGNLLVPIIVKLKKLSGGEEFLPKSWKASIRRVLTVTTLSLAGLALSKSPIQMGDIRAIWEDIEKRDRDDSSSILLGWETLTDAICEIQIAFQEVVKVVLKEQKCDRLVLCIDNLDRCSPDHAVNLLESIKNFFSVPGCVWLFAMDSDVIASYIHHKYEGTVMDGNSYLDKIIPEQYHLSFFPEENDHRVFDLISDATGGSFTLDEGRFPQIPRVMVPRRLKKSAGKLAEYFAGNIPNVDSNTVFLMSLLYHTWPDFYERLSSSSLKHVGGVLANFYGKDQPDRIKKWGDYNALSLGGDFAGDRDIIYFLKTAFPLYDVDAGIVSEIKRALDGLRRIGLP